MHNNTLYFFWFCMGASMAMLFCGAVDRYFLHQKQMNNLKLRAAGWKQCWVRVSGKED